MSHDFDAFWAAYPRKVGKFDAIKAYTKARRLATEDEIMIGVQQYNAHLPSEVQFIAHPATWLNKGRWLDEYEVRRPQMNTVDWFQECRQIHGGECGLDRFRHFTRKRTEGAA